MMQPDDELCLCFHVTQRKIANYIRLHDIQRPSQLAECFGAGTGCGWCRPFLKQLLTATRQEEPAELPSASQYAQDRSTYVRSGHGTPPAGATPITGP